MKRLLSYNRGATHSISNVIVIALVVLTLALSIIGPGPAQVDWGFNQADYLPAALYYLWLLLAVASIALLFLSPQNHYISTAAARYFWGDKKILGRAALLAGALIVFFIFRFDAHLYGDGYARVANFAQKSKPVFRWFEYGGTIIPYVFYQIIQALGTDKVTAAFRAYQIISYASGIGYLFLSLRISELVSDDGNDRIGFFALTVFTGFTMFFFGMVENSPILLPIIAAFIYLILRQTRSEQFRYGIYLWVVSIISILLDARMIPLIPASLYITFDYLFKRRKIGRFLASLIASVAVLGGIAIMYLEAVGNITLSKFILFPSGKLPDANYSLFSSRHLADIFNLLYMFVPLLGVYLYAIIRGFRHLKADRLFTALAFTAVSQILCIFIIDPSHGMARDIHIFGFLVSGVLFWGVYSLVRTREKSKLSRDVFMTLVPVSLVIMLPIFFVHLSVGASEKYLDDFLSYNETKYEPALVALRDYYITKGDNDKAVEAERSITAKAPGALESQLVNDLYAHDRVSEAFEYAINLVERYPYNAKYRMQKGNILKHYKRFADAEKEMKTAVELEPHSIDFHHLLSELYRETRREQDCFEILNRAINIDPKSTLILVDLAGYYYRTGQTRTSDSLTDVILDLDPEEPYGYMYKGLISERRGLKEAALDYYDRFVELNENLPEIPLIRKRMNSIVLEMRDTTSQE
jgi:predicted Zn-dependent protease